MLQKLVAYDTETTAIRRHKPDAEVFSYSTCNTTGQTDVARLDGPTKRKNGNRDKLEQLWTNSNITKVMHNAKFDIGFTEKLLGKKLTDQPFDDTYLMSIILQNDHMNHGLKNLGWELSRIPKDDESAIKAFLRNGGNYSHVPEHLMDEYQKRDVERCMLLHLCFKPKIEANSKYKEIYQNELNLIRPTIDMENRGVMVNRSRCEEMIVKLHKDVRQVENDIKACCGWTMNPGKRAHLERFLYQDIGMPVIRTTKTGLPSTDKNTLAELKELYPNPKIDMVLKWRSWTRGISMFQGYLSRLDSDDVLHPDIWTNGAKTTGRESCKDPNLQNVEKSGALLNPFPVAARKVFRPRPGYVNFHVDYSQIELRLLVHYSKEPMLIKTINDGGDVHAIAADVFYEGRFQNAIGKTRKLLRDAAKGCNFAIPYGANAAKAAKILGLDFRTGKKRFDNYRRMFPGLVNLNQTFARQARQDGYIETIFGRRLYVSKMKAYVATNYIIQGTAARILKEAQVRVHRYLESTDLNMLLPIHDELIIECPRKCLKDAEEIFRDIRELMIDYPMFDVPMDVDVEVATVDWADKEAFEL